MVRPTYAEIDLGAIAHNVRAFQDLIAPSEVCAVVKADGYGHGDAPIASTAIDAGATRLGVALVEEGVRLREAGVEAPILLLSEPSPDAVNDIVKWDLTPTAYSVRFIEALALTGAKFDVHLKIDTGMHRVGAAPRLVHDLMESVSESPNLTVGALWTHFAVAEGDRGFTGHQIEVFDETVSALGEIPMVHLANTAGAIHFPEARRDMCRIGLGIYGLHPDIDSQDVIDLQPAMRLVSHVSHIQRLEAGARPSYGRIKELVTNSKVATVPVGYADGYARGLSQYGCALIGGHRFPLAGTVTMDQVVIDVGDADIGIGDEVVLLGSQRDQIISANEWAEELGTISYEVVCSIGPRVPRRYLK